MNKSRTLLSLAIAIFWSLLTTSLTQFSASASDDESLLCTNHKYETWLKITTESYDAAICYSGYRDSSGCYIATKYFYIGRDRKTGASITLPAVEQKSNNSNFFVYKAKNGNLTYQMATSGGYAIKPWSSLSVFSNGTRLYHKVNNSFYGFYDC
jgi:hypothetical protein